VQRQIINAVLHHLEHVPSSERPYFEPALLKPRREQQIVGEQGVSRQRRHVRVQRRRIKMLGQHRHAANARRYLHGGWWGCCLHNTAPKRRVDLEPFAAPAKHRGHLGGAVGVNVRFNKKGTRNVVVVQINDECCRVGGDNGGGAHQLGGRPSVDAVAVNHELGRFLAGHPVSGHRIDLSEMRWVLAGQTDDDRRGCYGLAVEQAVDHRGDLVDTRRDGGEAHQHGPRSGRRVSERHGACLSVRASSIFGQGATLALLAQTLFSPPSHMPTAAVRRPTNC